MVGKNIEGGLKGTFAGGALNVAGSLFYIETYNTPVFRSQHLPAEQCDYRCELLLSHRWILSIDQHRRRTPGSRRPDGPSED